MPLDQWLQSRGQPSPWISGCRAWGGGGAAEPLDQWVQSLGGSGAGCRAGGGGHWSLWIGGCSALGGELSP